MELEEYLVVVKAKLLCVLVDHPQYIGNKVNIAPTMEAKVLEESTFDDSMAKTSDDNMDEATREVVSLGKCEHILNDVQCRE